MVKKQNKKAVQPSRDELIGILQKMQDFFTDHHRRPYPGSSYSRAIPLPSFGGAGQNGFDPAKSVIAVILSGSAPGRTRYYQGVSLFRSARSKGGIPARSFVRYRRHCHHPVLQDSPGPLAGRSPVMAAGRGVPGLPASAALSLRASMLATSGVSLRTVESASMRTRAGFLVSRSVTLIVLAAGSTEINTVAAMFRKEPETIYSGVSWVPSSFLLPSARTWSPTFKSAKVLGLADRRSAPSQAHSGAYRPNRKRNDHRWLTPSWLRTEIVICLESGLSCRD